MTKHYKLPLAAFALLLSAFASATVVNAQLAPNYVRSPHPNETLAPKVVFVGYYDTAQWASAFAANPNWINQGNPSPFYPFEVPTINMAAAIALHPTFVHLMIGLPEEEEVHAVDANDYLRGFVSELTGFVQQVQAANIKVILGVEPGLSPGLIEAVITGYGAVNNIPVINYGNALAGGEDLFNLYGGGPYFAVVPAGTIPNYPFPEQIITPTGYNLMTQLAESVINTMNLKLEAGWLSNVQQPNGEDDVGVGVINVNTVYPQAVLQFIPIGYYSDGSQHAVINTTFQGSSGTWTSSNPLVMYINQQGLAWALSQGTTTIKYTAPDGVAFAPWVMNVN